MPMVRAMRGSFSGPITTRAMTASTIISEKPMSNMVSREQKGAAVGACLARGQAPRSGLGLGLALDLAFDRLARHLRCRARLGRLVGSALAHAVLEAAHRAAEIGAHVAQLLRAEDQQHDDQQNDPVSDAPAAHISSCSAPRSASLPPCQHGPEWARAAEDVHMYMIHLLMSDPAVVDDGAKAVGRSGLAREAPADDQHLADGRLV